jgi:Tol biopolymer transport system component
MVPSLGGAERTLQSVTTWFGSSLSWSPDGTSIAYSDARSPLGPFGIYVLTLATLETRQVTKPTSAHIGDAFPAFSPDGRSIAFARVSALGGVLIGAELSVVAADGGKPRVLERDPMLVGGLDWTPDGSALVFSSSRTSSPRLWRIDIAGGGSRAEELGQDPLLSNVISEAVVDVSLPFRVSVARKGRRLAYARSFYDTDIWGAELTGDHQAGPPRKVVATTRLEEAPNFSPDGRRIAFSSARATVNPEIWVCNADGANCFQLTSLGVPCGTPRWSPIGDRIAFDAPPDSDGEVFTIDVQTRLARRLTRARSEDGVPSWSRDGRWIYFASDRSGSWQVWKMPSEGGEASRVTSAGGFAASESTDGKWLYYTRSWSPGLWRMPIGGGAEKRVLDVPQCNKLWVIADDGIYVVDSNSKPRAVIELFRPPFRAPKRVHVFAGEPACSEPGLTVSPDGRSILYVDGVRTSDIMLVENYR